MNDAPYNPDDPALLASRSLDEELSASEQNRLDGAMAADASLRAEAEELRAVYQLVKKWGAGQVSTDWATFVQLVEAHVGADPDDERDRKLDELLAGWSDGPSQVDEDGFTSAVMSRIEQRSSRPWVRKLVFRLGAPLAAAAAVALVVTSSLLDWSTSASHTKIVIGRAPAAPTRVAVVSFRREPAKDYVPEQTTSDISFLFVGAAPLNDDTVSEPPSM